MLNKQQDHLPLHACLECGVIVEHFFLSVTLKGKGSLRFKDPYFHWEVKLEMSRKRILEIVIVSMTFCVLPVN